MSELKATSSGEIRARDALLGYWWYEKSEVDKVIARHKYKRCLDKANYWVAVSYQCVDDKHRQRAEKHNYKWLELAEKFKEAKL